MRTLPAYSLDGIAGRLDEHLSRGAVYLCPTDTVISGDAINVSWQPRYSSQAGSTSLTHPVTLAVPAPRLLSGTFFDHAIFCAGRSVNFSTQLGWSARTSVACVASTFDDHTDAPRRPEAPVERRRPVVHETELRRRRRVSHRQRAFQRHGKAQALADARPRLLGGRLRGGAARRRRSLQGEAPRANSASFRRLRSDSRASSLSPDQVNRSSISSWSRLPAPWSTSCRPAMSRTESCRPSPTGP